MALCTQFDPTLGTAAGVRFWVQYLRPSRYLDGQLGDIWAGPERGLGTATMTSEIMIFVSLPRGGLRHFCGLAIFVAIASAATAAERVLPRQMLGTWCGVPAKWQEIAKRVFERGKCDPEDDTSILVRPDGYQGTDFNCKILEISSKREGARIVYVMRNRCDGEGGVLVENLSVWLADNGNLILRWKR